jgi:hypothetical protein
MRYASMARDCDEWRVQRECPLLKYGTKAHTLATIADQCNGIRKRLRCRSVLVNT